MKSHNGMLILVLGILGLTICGICAPIAWILGQRDLKEIQAGTMDPSGEQLTNIGRILGIIGTVLIAVAMCIGMLWIGLVLTYAGSFSEFSPVAMVSQSRDGDLIADLCRLLNFRPVRGSSSRGGREALAAMVAELSVQRAAVHAVDGPQGPRGIIKSGLIRMAQLSGVPIAPLTISVNRAWILKSWDRFLIPKPFSTISVHWDNLIPVPETLDDIAFETVRQEIEKRMRENQAEDDKNCGWRESLL